MTIIPPNAARVPNFLASKLMTSSLTRASAALLDMQVQLSSGKAINKPSDDPVGTSSVSVLDDIIERRDQRLRNLSSAEAQLNNVDAALGDLSTMLIEAKGVAASQIGLGSDAATRKNQARVIDAILAEAIGLSNRKYRDLYYFGGDATRNAPMVEMKGGLRYTGQGDGFTTDLGQLRPLPVTVSGESAFGALSTRVEGNQDLDPVMLADTRIVDLEGARGLGVTLGTVEVRQGANLVTVDLSEAHTVDDVRLALETEINDGFGESVTVDIDPVSGNRFRIRGQAADITISDPTTDATAADLGLNKTFIDDGVNDTGFDVDPRVTDETLITSLSGLTLPLGSIRLSNIGQTRDLDLSGVTNVEELKNAVEGLDLGIRVEISDDGNRLDFVNELSGGDMSIGEVAGGTTATELGIRSFTTDTRLDDFNNGLGVQIRTGSVDPITGLPDPAKDLDFRVTTEDGTTFDVDLAGALTVQDVLDDINAAALAAGLLPADFTATLVTDGNGISLVDNTGGAGATTVAALNGSFAADDLGLLGAGAGGGAGLAGADRAMVAVDSVFTHLINLRTALETNDERGITLAGEKLEADIARAAQTRAEVGVRTRRVTDSSDREEGLQIQDKGLRSGIQDLDFTEAAMRFALLQQQLQAGLQTAGRISSLSLLDFI